MWARWGVRRKCRSGSVGGRSGASGGLGLLDDERAVHAHQRRQGSVNRVRKLSTSDDRIEKPEFRPLDPLKHRHQHLRREFQAGLLDRKHLPAALVA